MLQYERQQSIMDYLKLHHTATIQALAKHLYTSEASVRRDIAALEAAGLVMKVYGGVVLPEHKNEVVPVELREGANSAAKEIIAAAQERQQFTIVVSQTFHLQTVKLKTVHK